VQPESIRDLVRTLTTHATALSEKGTPVFVPSAFPRRGYRVASLIACVTALVVVAGAMPDASAATAPTVTGDPAASAAGWLDGQFVDGTHFDFPGGDFYWGGLTASGVFALAAAKVGSSRIDAATGYMEANAASDADLTDSFGGPFDGSVATYVLAAIVAGVDPTSFGGNDLAQQLITDQCTSVSAPASDTDTTTPTCPGIGAARNIFSSVSESLAIIAESRAAAGHGSSYAPDAAAIAYFLSLQCPNGGFTGDTTACTDNSSASVDETGYASMALAALGGHASQLAAADAWLVSQRNAAGYWVVQGGPDVDSTGLAAAALAGAGQDVSTSRHWLAEQQVTTGPTAGAGASRGALKYQGAFDASSSIKATADGLLGMVGNGSLATLTASGASAGAPLLALAAPTVSAASVAAGGALTVTGTGFAAGETVAAVLHSTPVILGSAKASSTGTVVVHGTVAATLAAGRHDVVLTGASSGLTSSVAVTVTAAAGGTSTGSGGVLADTGSDGHRMAELALLGVVLIAAGAGAGYAGRRRQR
jgi:hypothetical protein